MWWCSDVAPVGIRDRMSPHPPSGAGHRVRPHTADAQVEAWGPTREACLQEVVLGSVEVFLDTEGARASGRHTFRVEADDDDLLLLAVLEEVVFLLDTTGAVPVRVEARSSDGGWDVRFDTVEAQRLPQVGAVPKAVSLHELRFGRSGRPGGGWSCLVTWDV